MGEGELERRAAVEVAVDRQRLDEAAFGVDAHQRAELVAPRDLVRREVGGLDLRGARDGVDDLVVAVAAGDEDQADAGDDHRQRQGDHQPHDRHAPGRLPGTGIGIGIGWLAGGGGLVHHMGPKKVLSTVSRVRPSTDSITKRMAWRPRTVSGAPTSSGMEATSPAGTGTTRSPTRSAMPAVAASSVTRKFCLLSDFITSLSVKTLSTPSVVMRYSALRSRSTSAISGLRLAMPQAKPAISTSSNAP